MAGVYLLMLQRKPAVLMKLVLECTIPAAIISLASATLAATMAAL